MQSACKGLEFCNSARSAFFESGRNLTYAAMSVLVKGYGRRPAQARASGLLAGVRKPPKDERTGVIVRYGDLAEAARARRRHGPLRRPLS